MAVTNDHKLELSWLRKENRPRLRPRILGEDPGWNLNGPLI